MGTPYDCGKCGLFVPLSQEAWDRMNGKVVHMQCLQSSDESPAPEREPVKLRMAIRAFCRKGEHDRCSGVQSPTDAAPYFMVCSCSCHQEAIS